MASNRANYRLNPNDGTISATDGTPSIGAAAYTNSFVGASTTSATTLYDYDELLNTLNTQLPPNDGWMASRPVRARPCCCGARPSTTFITLEEAGPNRGRLLLHSLSCQ